jgi:predicted ATPase
VAFCSLSDNDQQELIHYNAGKVYLARGGGESCFLAAKHLNCAKNLTCSRGEEKQLLAEVNVAVAKHCKEMSAFNDAVGFLCKALGLLDSKEKWETSFDLTFLASADLARLELILGNLTVSRALVEEALFHANTLEKKVGLLLIDLEVNMALNDMVGSVLAGNRALKAVGVHLPRNVTAVTILNLVMKLGKVKRMLHSLSNQEILNMPVMHDNIYGSCCQIASKCLPILLFLEKRGLLGCVLHAACRPAHHTTRNLTVQWKCPRCLWSCSGLKWKLQ